MNKKEKDKENKLN